MMDAYTDWLSEYLDDELDAARRDALEAHLAECDACRGALADLRTIVADAAALAPGEPPHDLWPGIAARIEAGRMVALPQSHATGRRRLSFTVPQLAAASLVLMLASAGSVALLTRAAPGDGPAAAPPAGSVVPAAAGTPAAAAADAELVELEAALAGGETQLDPATIAVLRRNLLIIDQALAEARAALQSDPANPYLSRHYANTLNKKRALLQQAGSIGRGST